MRAFALHCTTEFIEKPLEQQRVEIVGFPPGNSLWRADDFLTVAMAVRNANMN
jgi:hypothetical protein